MTARAEVEEILEQGLWAERNGMEDMPIMNMADRRWAYLPPAEALTQHERREHPANDCYDDLPLVPVPLYPLLVILGLGVFAALVWAWNYALS